MRSERGKSDTQRQVNGPLRASHGAARWSDPQGFSRCGRVAHHVRAHGREQCQQKGKPLIAEMDGNPAQEKELVVAIDDRIEHFSGVGSRTRFTRHNPVERVSDRGQR